MFEVILKIINNHHGEWEIDTISEFFWSVTDRLFLILEF